MDTQPDEILNIILSYVSPIDQLKCRCVSVRWKNIIEQSFTKNKKQPATVSECIFTSDYYYFTKVFQYHMPDEYYLNVAIVSTNHYFINFFHKFFVMKYQDADQSMCYRVLSKAVLMNDLYVVKFMYENYKMDSYHNNNNVFFDAVHYRYYDITKYLFQFVSKYKVVINTASDYCISNGFEEFHDIFIDNSDKKLNN